MVRWACALVALLLSGCVTVPKVEMAASGTLKSGQSVTLLEPPPIKRFYFYGFHPGMAFGAIGGLVAGTQFEQRGAELFGIAQTQGMRPAQELQDDMRRRLQAAGVQVRTATVPWIEKEGALVPDLKGLGPEHERILAVQAMTIGFAAWQPTSDYLPLLRVRTTLYGKDRNVPLYDGQHMTGWSVKFQGAAEARPGLKGVPTYVELVAQPVRVVTLLRDAITRVGESVAGDMHLPSASLASPTQGAPAPAPITSTESPVAAKSTMADFSGTWKGRMNCGPYLASARVDNPGPWSVPIVVEVVNGAGNLKRGDATYSESITGTVAADRSIEMSGKGALRSTPGSTWTTHVFGRFDPRTGEFGGQGHLNDAAGRLVRECTVSARPG